MGQPEVYEFLRSRKLEWFTARQIAENTDLSLGSVSVALKGLRKTQLVDYKVIKTSGYKGAKRGTYAYRFRFDTQLSLLEFT